jgi:protein-tyrosine-phosphatase
MKDKQRVLIVCTGNSTPFQIVEGLLRQEAGDRCEIVSACTQESHVPPEAISIMEEIGIDISRLRSHAIDEVTGQKFDYVISVGANEQACPNVSGNPQRLHWPVQFSPVLAGSEERRVAAFREIRDQLHGFVMILVGKIAYSTWIGQAENATVVTELLNRPALVRRGQRLEYFAIGWNSLEGVVSIIAGAFAGSVSLIGFGLDSLIEVTSGAAVLWRLHHVIDSSRRVDFERRTLRIVGVCFVSLALYMAYDSAASLIRHEAAKGSVPGIMIAILSLCVMPLLARAKRRVAEGIESAAMQPDSRQMDFCAYLSAILLGGLVLNAVFSWWWADPVAGLVMVPIIAKEGVDGLRARACRTCHSS